MYPTTRSRADRRALMPCKEGWVIAARVGSPAEPHVLVDLHCRWEAERAEMALTVATIAKVETIPGGQVDQLVERLRAARAAALAEAPLGGWHVYVDVSRSPEVRHELYGHLPEAVPVLVPGGARTDAGGGCRLLGRLSLMSGMSVMLGNRKLRAGSLETGDDPRRLDRERVREVLARAQARPPALGEEELALAGSVDDDAALCVALAAWVANENPPDPYVPGPRR